MANEVAEKKPSQLAQAIEPVREYFRDTIGELRKVHWPTRLEARNLTFIVLGVTFAMAVVLGLMDLLFEQLILKVLRPDDPGNLVFIAIAAVIVLAIIVLVIFAGRERR